MKGFITISRLIIFLLGSGFVFLIFGQETQPLVSKLKVNDWVKIKGVPQNDSKILLKEIRVIYGEVESDDWEVMGVISRLVPEEMKIFIFGFPVMCDKDTKYKSFESFSDIKSGIYVEIDGSFSPDGTFMAIEIETDEVEEDELSMIRLKGKVQSVNEKDNSFTMMGHTVIITPETKVKSLIHH